eukprot:NODE_5892_length_597_cov_22.495745_g5727_i0.p1 GENE.NODE_5892_length_597_cov_22.495745_g5727_i0~~NODE_5892_length_597_cov_22.495745_g5727_i0.p1  ORF type:complete len:184 (-),score=81.52 NODE_5892_length_597_cov_22.495745_g5727_i0:46-540(-)
MGEEPSRVLHLRNVTGEVTQLDIQSMACPFGTVENIVLLREKHQALIQMESVAAASNLMQFYASGYCELAGRRVYIKYSRHSELTGKSNAVSFTMDMQFSNLEDLNVKMESATAKSYQSCFDPQLMASYGYQAQMQQPTPEQLQQWYQMQAQYQQHWATQHQPQ